MARKRTLSTLDTSISYEAVGLDLAKEDVALPHSILNTRNLISLTEYPTIGSMRFWPTWLQHWSPWSHAAVLIESFSQLWIDSNVNVGKIPTCMSEKFLYACREISKKVKPRAIEPTGIRS